MWANEQEYHQAKRNGRTQEAISDVPECLLKMALEDGRYSTGRPSKEGMSLENGKKNTQHLGKWTVTEKRDFLALRLPNTGKVEDNSAVFEQSRFQTKAVDWFSTAFLLFN